VKNAEYAKMYYRRMKDAYDLSKLPPVNWKKNDFFFYIS
jgi:hypothetical protein